MKYFENTGDGFRLRKGTYAITPRWWNGDMPDPRPENSGEYLYLPKVTEVTAKKEGDLEILLVPIGKDQGGAIGRTLAMFDASIVAFEQIGIVPCKDVQRSFYPYAGHVDNFGIVTFDDDVNLLEDKGSFEFRSDNDHWAEFEVNTPGAFFIDGDLFDMNDPFVAKAFDYGSDTFNEELDEHGFFCNPFTVLDRIKDVSGGEAIALRNRLSRLKTSLYAYYAPVN
jgi:hypothetical protein